MGSMHDQMRDDLLLLARTLAAARNWQMTTVSLRAYGKADFFDNLAQDAAGTAQTLFSARKFDTTVAWFRDNWPAETPWPLKGKR